MRDTCSNSTLDSSLINKGEFFIQDRNCFCDPFCQEYGDCCAQPTLSSSNNYECVDFISPIMTKNIHLTNSLFIWMRTKCLPIYSGSQFEIYCQNLNNQTFLDNSLLFIPVTSVNTNITYRNYYCAYCNNDVNSHIKVWEYKANCPGNSNFFDNMTLDKKEQVDYYIHNLTIHCTKTISYPRIQGTNQPSVFIRPCKKSRAAICPAGTDRDLARNCSLSSIAYRYDVTSDVIYPNSYCAKCNNISTSQITCFDPILRSNMFLMYQIRVPSLSILFNPNIFKRYLSSHSNVNSIKQTIYSLSYNCTKSNELYDLFLQKCSQITNLEKQITVSMKCSYPMHIIENYIQYNNGSLYLVSQSILLNRGEYVFIDEQHIIFCGDQWKQNRPTFSFYRNVLTIICTIISLVCFAIFVIIFWLIPSLQNLPGSCLLFLSISMFIGQLLFISTSDLTQYSSLCLVSAIFIHYFYLSSFFWLLTISVHIYLTFNGSFVRQEKINNKKSRLLIYNVLVWCSTGIIILIPCLIQFTNPRSQFSPKYGHLYCSMSQPNAIILFFLVPIGCVLSIIAVLFIKTIIAIHRSNEIAQLANSSSSITTHSSNNHVFIYVRLASLMGLQWILLVVALIVQQEWSWIIFELVDSLPGVFICFGFLCSQRLWNNIRQGIVSKLIRRRQSSRSHTTSTMLMSPPLQR